METTVTSITPEELQGNTSKKTKKNEEETGNFFVSASEQKKCSDCHKTFKSCQCKSCSKCGALFNKYWGTNLAKGRSHCRVCFAAVCLTCHVVLNNTFKICTRCHIRQKEEELSTQKALSAIDKAKSGRSDSGASQLSSDYVFINVAAAGSMTNDQKKEALFEATKKGDHYALVTLLNANADANAKDASRNTPLFYAAEGGFLPCVALLMERGANITLVNDACWTPLHAVAWKGSTDDHVECAELLIQMGADVFALTSTSETAADLAERCGGKLELVQLLRGAEVDVAVKKLQRRLRNASPKDILIKLYIEALIHHITKDLDSSFFDADNVSQSSSPNSSPMLLRACNKTELENNQGKLTPDKLLRSGGKTASLDRRSNVSKELKFDNIKVSASPLSRAFGSSQNLTHIPRADVEPIIRTDYTLFPPSNSASLEEKLRQSQSEKEDVENRCKRLMQAMAVAAEDHEKEVSRLKQEIEQLKEKNEITLKRVEATYANKISMVRQEAETSVHEANEQVKQVMKDRSDLLHLQDTFRLTWVPDELVAQCSNPKCRSPFAQTRRRHHCRCCGRVFCNVCTDQKTPLSAFGYHQPVRVCNPCYALVDEMFVDDQDKT